VGSAAASPTVTVEPRLDGATWVVTLQRPERRNAVDASTAAALVAAFRRFDSDPGARVAILTGAGGTFCAGADLKALAEGEPRPVVEEGDGPMGPTRMRLSKPVIAAVEGHAVAGGLELALWCDLRVAAADAVLGVFCRRFGVPLVDLGTVRLPRIVGLGRALDLVLTGRAVSGEEALSFGLVNRLVPRGQALPAALELAATLAVHPQLCLRNDRLSMLEGLELPEEEAMRNEVRRGRETLASGEMADGVLRFSRGAGRHGT
jgi:enoyl-CoA hydratase